MDATRFDTLARSLQRHAQRRSALGVLGGGLAALLTRVGWDDADAKKTRKSKKKVKRNAFGCVSVGKACRGKDRLCCSGICKGKKPKQGAKDTSRCVAHDTGGCLPGTDACDESVDCTTSAGNPGHCGTTTGHAGYCLDVVPGHVQPCRRDADCREALGATAACVTCSSSVFTGCKGIQTS